MLLALATFAFAQDPGIDFEVHGTLMVGEVFNVSLVGAEPGQRFYIVYSQTEGLSCPPIIAPTCMDVQSAVILRTGFADDEGSAYTVFNFPSVADGMFLQVVTDSDKSNVIYLDAEEEEVWVNEG